MAIFKHVNLLFIYGLLAFQILVASCSQRQKNNMADKAIAVRSEAENKKVRHPPGQLLNPSGDHIATRILTPKGAIRTETSTSSFAYYLRTLPLKEHGSEVRHYDGSIKRNHGQYLAVVDLPIGNKDLHQCADAVMRLRADYLWNQQQYDKIHFNFTNGFKVDYLRWMNGDRISVDGNQVSWIKRTSKSNSADTFWKYLEIIFSYAGTLSLSKEMINIPVAEMQIGDVFIQGGSPGHAVIVVDMSVHQNTGDKYFLLAQSYMPAQEIQILNNPQTPDNPWYPLNLREQLITPEWTFHKNDLKRFSE